MASILRIKRSEVSGNPATLGAGELAYSALPDSGANGGDRLYIGMGVETSGNAVNHIIIGGKRYTDMIDAATNISTVSTLVKRDSSGNFSAGTITANLTGNVTGDVTGNITSSGTSTFTTIDVNGGTIDGTSIGSTSANTITGTTITATSGFSGNLTGNVTGNVTGDLTGNVTGNITSTGTSTFTTIDVNGGTIDAAVIGGTVAAAITGTTITASTGFSGNLTGNVTGDVTGNITSTGTSTFSNIDVNGGTVDGAIIGGTSAAAITGSTITANTGFSGNLTGNVTGDLTGNVTGNITSSGTSTFTTIDVNGGNIDGTVIGAAVAAAITGTTITASTGFSGNLTGNVTGDLTGNASTATTWQSARNLTISGDATGTFSGVNGSANVDAPLTLANTGVTAGSYGSTTEIPTFTVDSKGRLTAAGTSTISTTLNITDGTNNDAVALGTDTLTFNSGTGVTAAVSNNQVSIAIGQAVGTTDNVTFNNVTVSGQLSSDDITAANISVAGNATITGNLTVQGTTTTVNSTTVAIGDKNITLAKDAVNGGEADGAGLTILGPTTSATILYNNTNNSWDFNKQVYANVTGNLTGNADTATKWATARNLTLSGDATGTLTAVDGTATVDAVVTLATVNSNVGSFGNSTSVPTLTVNAKGLVTALSSTSIPLATAASTSGAAVNGLASFSTTNFSVTSGYVTVSEVDGGTY